MPRRPRDAMGGYVYHVLNRAVGRATIFETAGDFQAFEEVLEQARKFVPMRLFAYCLMPNHWHLVLGPHADGDLSDYLRWITNTHTRRWHLAHGTVGTGPLYQGRFRSFPIQKDEHFLTVCRYVERNALRANLVARAQVWRWSSLWHRGQVNVAMTLAKWPVGYDGDWLRFVNRAQTQAELESLRRSARRGSPFGTASWQRRTAAQLRLESTLRSPGRPRKTSPSELK